MERKYFYTIEYASGMFAERRNQQTIIYSDIALPLDDFVVVEHTGYGVFIGKTINEVTPTLELNTEGIEYRFVQGIDLTGYLKEIENAKRKEELKEQMEKRFAEIDKEKKYQYYAELDPDFKAMYEEFKNL
jgi:hypothetical protein